MTTQARSQSVTAAGSSSRAAEGSVALAGEPLAADICVIGAGSGGISLATMAAAFGRKVVLVEKHRMGGGGLSGSIPSKALVATARRAHAMRTASEFGIVSVEPQIDYRAVQQHIKGAVTAAAPNDSVERLTGLGIRVILGAARFLDKRTLLAGDYRVTARRFVLATGSAPAMPEIAGLDSCSYSPTKRSSMSIARSHISSSLALVPSGSNSRRRTSVSEAASPSSSNPGLCRMTTPKRRPWC